MDDKHINWESDTEIQPVKKKKKQKQFAGVCVCVCVWRKYDKGMSCNWKIEKVQIHFQNHLIFTLCFMKEKITLTSRCKFCCSIV
jgi:hypothetical protein